VSADRLRQPEPGNTGNLAIAKLTGGTTATAVLYNIDGVNTAGNATFDIIGALIKGSGTVPGGTLTANALVADTTAGIGTSSLALATKVSYLTVTNTASSGTAPINIANVNNPTHPVMTVHLAEQDGAGNGGGITIDNTGGMVVDGLVHTSSGAIKLQTHSPLTIDGSVTTDSGNITLAAGTGYGTDNVLTIGSSGERGSTSGKA
jgi:hypothetical protein